MKKMSEEGKGSDSEMEDEEDKDVHKSSESHSKTGQSVLLETLTRMHTMYSECFHVGSSCDTVLLHLSHVIWRCKLHFTHKQL